VDINKPVLGTTLYSFTNEWLQGLYTLDQEVEKVAELGLGPAMEVVGFQSIREYPDVTDEFARHFRDLLDRHVLTPSCLGGNCDIGRDPKRLMTEDETVAYVERQIVSAQKLGFPVLRIQTFVGPRVFERLAPLAEKAGVQVACELHSPLSAHHPEVVALRECFDRVGPDLVGFVPDFSCSMIAPPNIHWEKLRQVGAPEGLIAAARDVWSSDRPVPEKFAALAEAAARFGATDAIRGQLNMTLTMFGRMPVEDLVELLPYTKHIHGKFYEVDASGVEASLPYPELMALLEREGYRGTISAEWEGHAFTEEPIGFEQLQAWRAMCDRLLGG
jgi:sugar phosphate isomerase/epimerase